MLKKILFLIIFAPLFTLSAHKTTNNFIVVSIPKSGTHLLLKCIHMLTNLEPAYFDNFDSSKHLLNSTKNFYWTHSNNSLKKHNIFRNNLNLKTIVVIRDLRDIIVSYANWIDKDINTPKKTLNKFKTLSYDDKLTFSLNLDFLQDSLNDIKIWLNDPNVLIIRFEDLIGKEGSGSDVQQKKTIKDIATSINIDLKEENLLKIQKNLFGNKNGTWKSNTFTSGKIGNWKSIFQNHHKKLFKKLYGQYIILLGYENDNSW